MQEADQKSWDRLVGLSKACGEQKTALCEAAMVIRTISSEPAVVPAAPAKPPVALRTRRNPTLHPVRRSAALRRSEPTVRCDPSGQNPDDCDPGCNDCGADAAEPAQ